MSKYRIGTTIGITVQVTNLPSTSVEFYVKSDFGLRKLDNVSVSGSLVSGAFLGADQKFLGEYSVILRSGARTLCVDNAFWLVKHSEDTEDADNTTVRLSGTFLTYPTHISGYEEWRNTNGGTIQDYWNWLREDSEEITRRVTKVEQRITDEEKARKEADEILQYNIDQEAQKREEEDEKLYEEIQKYRDEWRADLEEEKNARKDADIALQQNINNEAQKRVEADTALDIKHTRGKIFCNGILAYGENPTQSGYYLQKDIDNDIACLTLYNASTGTKEYIDAPTEKIFVVDERLFVRELFKIVPIGYKEVIINVATPMSPNDEVDYTMQCNVNNAPTKKIQITSIKQ